MQNSQWTGFVDFMDQQSTNDYYPFGSQLPNRGFDPGSYKFGFNGKEQDDEIYGDDNAYDFGARIYDAQIGRWMSCDPKSAKYTSLSPYVFVANSPLIAIDPNGEEIVITTESNAETGKTTITVTLTGVVSFDHLSTTSSLAQRQRYVNNLNAKLQKVYSKSMSSENTDIVFVSNMRSGSDKDIAASDHAIFVTNLQTGPNKVSGQNVGGFVNAIGGKKAYFPKSLDFYAASHEIGHWLGLAHPKDISGAIYNLALSYEITGEEQYSQYDGLSYDQAYNIFSNDNIMHHPGDPGTSEFGGENFDFIQVLMMQEASLNQGSNSWDFSNDKPGAASSADDVTTRSNIIKNAATVAKYIKRGR